MGLLQRLPCRIGGTVLRRLRLDDAEAFHAYRSDAELARYQGWSPMSAAEALAFVTETAHVDALAVGDWIQLAIADAASDALLGDLGLFVDERQHEAEVGFTLCRAAQGAGHATRAVAGALDLVFALSPVRRVQAVTDARNGASIAVLERAGFRRDSERDAVFKGEACVELVYVLARPG